MVGRVELKRWKVVSLGVGVARTSVRLGGCQCASDERSATLEERRSEKDHRGRFFSSFFFSVQRAGQVDEGEERRSFTERVGVYPPGKCGVGRVHLAGGEHREPLLERFCAHPSPEFSHCLIPPQYPSRPISFFRRRFRVFISECRSSHAHSTRIPVGLASATLPPHPPGST